MCCAIYVYYTAWLYGSGQDSLMCSIQQRDLSHANEIYLLHGRSGQWRPFIERGVIFIYNVIMRRITEEEAIMEEGNFETMEGLLVQVDGPIVIFQRRVFC
jgi:hypothetical protein